MSFFRDYDGNRDWTMIFLVYSNDTLNDIINCIGNIECYGWIIC